MTQCKLPGCNEASDGKSNFCSTFHEVKYDHLKDDARQAKLDAEREAESEGV